MFGTVEALGLLEVHAVTTSQNPPRPPSSLLPLIPLPSGLVSWHTPTLPVNIAWLEGSVFPNRCNWMTHSRTRRHFGRVCGNTLDYNSSCHSNTWKTRDCFLSVVFWKFLWNADATFIQHCSDRAALITLELLKIIVIWCGAGTCPQPVSHPFCWGNRVQHLSTTLNPHQWAVNAFYTSVRCRVRDWRTPLLISS